MHEEYRGHKLQPRELYLRLMLDYCHEASYVSERLI